MLLGRKTKTNLDRIFKNRDITLPKKVFVEKAIIFPVAYMDVRVGLYRKLSPEKLMVLKCGVGKDSCDFLGQQGNKISQ